MNTDVRFTDGRIPDSQIRGLVSDEYRWQRWLDVEVALASAEAECGIVPRAAAQAIRDKAVVGILGKVEIQAEIFETSHPMMAMVSRLSKAVGQPYGGWVHWGATTQNITQTGDMLVLREVHGIFLTMLGRMFEALEHLATQGQDMICAGRTHGQHAVPITFGFKVAGWIDEYARHAERLQEIEPRIFVAMMGGAVGNFASLGEKGPEIQNRVADLLELGSMEVPSRAVSDAQAEYVCLLGLMAGTGSKIAKEISHLMQTELGEVLEPAPTSVVGSSTMPHKRNPQLAEDCIAIAAQIKSLVPLALDGMENEYEVSSAATYMIDDAILRSCILTGDLLTRLVVILSGLELNRRRMLTNLELSGGLMCSEAVMLALGESVGRQRAHEIVYEDAQMVAAGRSFEAVLLADARVTKYLSRSDIRRLLDPRTKIGLSVEMSLAAARQARELAVKLSHTTANLTAISG